MAGYFLLGRGDGLYPSREVQANGSSAESSGSSDLYDDEHFNGPWSAHNFVWTASRPMLRLDSSLRRPACLPPRVGLPHPRQKAAAFRGASSMASDVPTRHSAPKQPS
jgi:hypothetical protein